MNRHLLLVWAISLAALYPAPAQLPPPQPPLVAAPAPGTSWEIVLHFDADDAPAEPGSKPAPPTATRRLPAKIATHCGKDVTAIVVTWTDGTRTEAWVKGDRFLEKNAVTGSIVALPVQDQEPSLPLFTKGYPGTAWLAPGKYKGTDPIGKKTCYRFEDTVTISAPGDAGSPPLTRRAWIEAPDKIPLRVKLDNVTYEYGPVQPAPADIELPPDVSHFLEQVNLQENALEIMRRNQQH